MTVQASSIVCQAYIHSVCRITKQTRFPLTTVKPASSPSHERTHRHKPIATPGPHVVGPPPLSHPCPTLPHTSCLVTSQLLSPASNIRERDPAKAQRERGQTHGPAPPGEWKHRRRRRVGPAGSRGISRPPPLSRMAAVPCVLGSTVFVCGLFFAPRILRATEEKNNRENCRSRAWLREGTTDAGAGCGALPRTISGVSRRGVASRARCRSPGLMERDGRLGIGESDAQLRYSRASHSCAKVRARVSRLPRTC